MKTKFERIWLPIVVLLLVIFAYTAGLRAQQSPAAPGGSTVITNWLGYIVVGETDRIDPITVGGPYPTVLRNLEIGVRSDGLLVYRNSFRNQN